MHIVFYSTTDVFRAEELINTSGSICKVVPTPVQDKAYCGVCVETEDTTVLNLLNGLEYQVLE